MTLRKLTLATVATIALTSGAFAADTTANGQWGVGAALINSGDTSTAAEVTYLNNMFIVQGGLGYNNVSVSSSSANDGDVSRHVYNTNMNFGLRNMMNNQVSLDYGVAALYGFASNKADGEKNPYSVGAFVGVDFQPVQNILLTADIQPYAYTRDTDSDKTSRVLSAGAVSVSYLF